MEFDQFVPMWWFEKEFKEERKKKKKKRNWEKKKKKKKEKGKLSKEENKKGSHQILWSEMEGRSTVLKKKSWKKNSWMEIPKRVDIDKSWKHFLYLPLPIFISFPLLLPYIMS